MGLEKFVPVSGLRKSIREFRDIDNKNISDGIRYGVKTLEVAAVGALNLGYVACAVAAVYSLMN